MANHILTRNYHKTPVESLTLKKAGPSFDQLALASQRNTTGTIALIREKDMQRNLDWDINTPDAQREKILAAVERPGSLENIQDLVEIMCANNITLPSLLLCQKLSSFQLATMALHNVTAWSVYQDKQGSSPDQ